MNLTAITEYLKSDIIVFNLAKRIQGKLYSSRNNYCHIYK